MNERAASTPYLPLTGYPGNFRLKSSVECWMCEKIIAPLATREMMNHQQACVVLCAVNWDGISSIPPFTQDLSMLFFTIENPWQSRRGHSMGMKGVVEIDASTFCSKNARKCVDVWSIKRAYEQSSTYKDILFNAWTPQNRKSERITLKLFCTAKWWESSYFSSVVQVQWRPIQMRAFHSNENGLLCTHPRFQTMSEVPNSF